MPRVLRQRLDAEPVFNNLTPHGKDWLIAATDPFHDYDLDLSGYPDISSEGTIVQLVKKSVTVSVPAGITGLWDMNVVMTPFMTGPETGIARTINGTGTVAGTAFPVGAYKGLSARFAASGSDTNAVPPEQVINLTPGDEYFGSYSRVISMGFEVANTTSDLNRQGAVAVYSSPARSSDDTVYVPVDGLFWPVPTETFMAPPQNLAEAMTLLGTRQWEAREGNYNVSRLSSIENPMLLPSNSIKSVRDVYGTTATSRTILDPNYSVVGGAAPPETPNTNKNVPYNYSGAYYTGLSQETTLTLTARWYIERAPTVSETQLVVMATPSPGVDMEALYLYSAIMRELPPGVMLCENGLGDFFKKVFNIAKKVIKPIWSFVGANKLPLSMLSDAILPGSGQYVNLVGNMASQKRSMLPGNQGAKTDKMAIMPVPQNSIMPIFPTKKKKNRNKGTDRFQNSLGAPAGTSFLQVMPH